MAALPRSFGFRFAGVIGMPANDGSTDVWYMLLDKTDSGFTVSWQRLAYDFSKSLQSTYDAGMREYAKALSDGLWPGMDILPEPERQKRGHRLDPELIK